MIDACRAHAALGATPKRPTKAGAAHLSSIRTSGAEPTIDPIVIAEILKESEGGQSHSSSEPRSYRRRATCSDIEIPQPVEELGWRRMIACCTESGVPGVIRTRDPRFHTTSAFAAADRRSWSGLSLRRGLWRGRRRRPSSLYTFLLRRLGSGLVWRLHAETFPDFERIHRGVSDLSAQF
jgi:hypothetical protein